LGKYSEEETLKILEKIMADLVREFDKFKRSLCKKLRDYMSEQGVVA